MWGQRPEIARLTMGDQKDTSRFLTWFSEADGFFQSSLEDIETAWDYFEGRQFSDEEMEILNQRGQPATVINKTRVSVELVMGIYDKTRMDPMLLPRGTGDDDWMAAQGLTHGCRYVEDCNYTTSHLRNVFRDVLVGGLGWMETGLNPDPTQEDLWEAYVDWRDIRMDPLSRRPDYSDARYCFRVKWMDLDEAKALLPEHKAKLDEVAGDMQLAKLMGNSVAGADDYLSVSEMKGAMWRPNDWIDTTHNRVLLLECWYYEWDTASFIRDKRTGRVVEYDPKNMGDAETALLMGGVTGVLPVEILRDRPFKRCRKALLAGPHLLEDEASPYRHNRIPFIPFWGWRDWKSGYPVGLVRTLRDPQDAANKALSKLILALSTNQVTMEKGAGDAEILRKEASLPNGFMVVERNSLKEGRFALHRNEVSAQGHQAVFELFHRVSSDMAGGLELQGLQSNAESGRAIALRQEQGNTTLSTVFENFKFGKRLLVEERVGLIQQYWTDEKYLAITEVMDPDRREFMVLNQRTPNGIRNDITALKVDVVIDEQSARSTVRQQFADRLMDFMNRMPDPVVAMSLMDVVVDMYDLPDRPKLKARIQQAQAMAGFAQQQQMAMDNGGGAMGDTAQSAAPMPGWAPPGGGGVGMGPEVLANLAAADAGPGVNNRGR